jgi:hypothetical protein
MICTRHMAHLFCGLHSHTTFLLKHILQCISFTRNVGKNLH